MNFEHQLMSSQSFLYTIAKNNPSNLLLFNWMTVICQTWDIQKQPLMPSASLLLWLSLLKKTNIREHYLGPSRVAVLDPAQVDCTETVPRDACESMVIVFVDVGIEGGIQVDVVPLPTSPQPVFHGLISQPLLQFGGSDHIVDDTLKPGRGRCS